MKTINATIEAIKTVRDENNFAADYMADLRENFSNEQINTAHFNVSFLDNLIETFGEE